MKEEEDDEVDGINSDIIINSKPMHVCSLLALHILSHFSIRGDLSDLP